MHLTARLSQKFSFGKSFHTGYVKRLITHLVLLSFIYQNLAFATQSIIELDFKDSETPQRLHVIPRLSNVGDVSHLEIDTEHKQAAVYLKEKQEEALDELQKHLSQGGDVPVTPKPVILKKHDIVNLPWDLEPEKLTLFILNHTAWLTSLDEGGYKLEFKGGLLGGMMKSGGGKKELVVEVTQFNVDCKGRNDYPSGTIGERFCNKNGNGSGNFGVNVFNKPYVPPVDKAWQNHCEKISNNPFGKQKIAYRPSVKDDKSDLEPINVNPKIRQVLGKEVYEAIRPLIDDFHKGEVQNIVRNIPDLAMEALSNYRGGDLSQKTIDEIVRNIGLYIDPRIKQTGSFRILNPVEYYRILDQDRRWMGKAVDAVSRKAVSCAYEGLKKQYADELEKQKKKQKIAEEEREKYEQTSSHEGSSLFKGVPSQYQVTPEYFARSAADAKLLPSQALNMILNPDPDNFYDRIILASRQNWLGGAKNTTTFGLEGLNNEQAYQYITQGYHKGDMPTLFNKIISQRGSALFKGVTADYFVAQAKEAGMMPFQALRMIFNPRPENFYDRVILASRQNWLGGKKNTTVFDLEDLTNLQAYQYIVDGYKPHDFPTLSHRLISQRGSALFEGIDHKYFSKQAEKAGMTPMEALNILMNPTLENFYDRVMLTSRDNWLGGAQDGTAFELEELTNEQAYQYMVDGYKPHDFPTLSHKLISQRLCIDADEPFDDQVLEDWGVKDWREAPLNDLEVPQFMRVSWPSFLAKKAFEKLVRTFTPQTQELLKGLDRYKAQLFARKGVDKSKTTLKAAEQERKGKQIPLAIERGRTYNHIEKVENAQEGLLKIIKDIKNRLGYPELSKIERQALEEQLSKTSKLLDHTEKFVPRGK